jgi:hypothetical protein
MHRHSATYNNRSSRSVGKNPLFENYKASNGSTITRRGPNTSYSTLRTSALSSISSNNIDQYQLYNNTRPYTSSFLKPQHDGRFALTLSDVSRDENSYGSTTRAESARRAKVVKRHGEWENLAITTNDKIYSNNANNVSTKPTGSSNNRKVWQWRGRTIAFGGKKSEAFHSGSVYNPVAPTRTTVVTTTTLNVPKGRWGGSVGKSPRLNGENVCKQEIEKNKKSLVPETSDDKPGKSKHNGTAVKKQQQQNDVKKNEEKQNNSTNNTKKNKKNANNATVKKIVESPNKMVFVIPESSKTNNKMKNQQAPILEKSSSPTFKKAEKSGLSNTIATSTPSKTLLKKNNGRKNKKKRRARFSIDSPEVKMYQPPDEKDKEILWHSHEDSIRNRIQLKQEKFEEKLAAKQKIEENIKEQNIELQTKKEKKQEAKRLKEKRKEREKKRRKKIRDEKEKERLRNKMKLKEKKELTKIQKQAAKAKKKIEKNMMQKFGLRVDEVKDKNDDDEAIHDKIAELEAELTQLKAKAIDDARVKLKKNMAGRTGRVVGKGTTWKKGQKQNVVDFHNSIKLPQDMIAGLSLQQLKKMKKHTYSFE